MKVLIITYSREVNPGTFLQAFGVQFAMRQLFPNAQIDLLKHKRLYTISGQTKESTSKPLKKDWAWLKGRLSAIPRRIKYEWNYSHKFHFTEQEFGLFDYNPKEFKALAENYDLVVVGSDTILIDLKKKDQYGLMWLLNVNTDKVLFAASAAPAKYELAEAEKEMLHNSFSSFKMLGVRDSITYNLLKEKIGLGDRIVQMFDPTYLIPSSFFKLPFLTRLSLTKIRKERKVALVNFGNGFEQKRLVTEYLKCKGYFTVSTLYNPWADKNLMTFSPFEWAALFPMIDLTVTERFHDSVFTLRNNRAVIAVDWAESRINKDGGSKTLNLLQKYGLSDWHCCFERADSLEKLKSLINRVDTDFNFEICRNVNSKICCDYDGLLLSLKGLVEK